MTDLPDLNAAYALKDENAVRALYATWAQSYDAGFGDAMGYRLPGEVARAFVGVGGQGPVLDVGAGTGLVAAHLVALKVGPVDALDISQEMLDVARDKQLYRDLFAANFLKAEHGLPEQTYRGIVCAGTFTHGHVGPAGLRPLAQLLATGGTAVISVNLAHFDACDFASEITALADVISASFQDVRIFDDRADTAHRNDMARLVILRKPA